MAVPLIGRWLAAVVGGLLVLTVWGSVIKTLMVPRPVGSWLTRWVDRLVNGAFSLATAGIAEYRRRDRGVAVEAPGNIAGAAGGLAGGVVARLLAADVAVGLWRPGGSVHRGRVLAVHPWVRGAGRGCAGGDRVRRRGDWSGDRDPADCLSADFVRGVQPQGDGGVAAERAGWGAVLGPGTAGTHPLRAGIWELDY